MQPPPRNDFFLGAINRVFVRRAGLDCAGHRFAMGLGDFMSRRDVKVSAFTPMGNQEPPNTVIQINGNIEIAGDKDASLETWGAIFDAEAEKLFVALTESLPGGTIDRLTGKLLAYKAGHFLVKG